MYAIDLVLHHNRHPARLRPHLLTAALSLACIGPTGAQDPTGNPDVTSMETVFVSAASRIDRIGFVAPTPTVVIGEVELQQGRRNNLGAVLNDLPTFAPVTTPDTTVTTTSNGATNANLRGLGGSRTLVLLDGRRFTGSDDLNSIPLSLVKSVDVVTGGASAAWGSDAVAGVVNIVLDNRFKGLALEARSGLSDRDDGFEYFVSAAGGTQFVSGRGHLIFGAEFLDNEGIFPRTSRPRIGRVALIANPDRTSASTFALVPDVTYSNSSRGGLILSGALAGQTFNPDGTLRPFQFGPVFGSNMIGGEGDNWDDVRAASAPQRRYGMFSRATFDLIPSVQISADFRYTNMYNHYNWFPDSNRGNLSIQADNAFLSEDIRNQLATTGETRFTMGRLNHDFAQLTIDYKRRTQQATVALDGISGDHWRWDTYISRGEYETLHWYGNFRLANEYAQAVDSILHPVTGQPVCRVTLTNPDSNCVPINLFGEGAPSQAASDYVTGTFWSNSKITLDTTGASLRGEPFSLWAGPVSVATGVEVRREQIRSDVDPRSANDAFITFNPKAMAGKYTVKEAFIETLIPLAKDLSLMRSLDFNGAARFSDYSTSGGIWSWKLGITNQLTDSLRLRATRSRDIRSANLSELYTTLITLYSNIVDPVTNQGLLILTLGGGNPELAPEISDTTTLGLVWEPDFAPGLSVSLDYFDIDIDRVITSISGQDIVTRCFNGNLELCGNITRNPETQEIELIRNMFINLSNYQSNGFDFDAIYRFSGEKLRLPGDFRVRSTVTYVDTLTIDDGVSRLILVGSGNNIMRWSGNLALGWQHAGLGLDLRARYLHSGMFDRSLDIQNNARGSRTWLDLNVNYDFNTQVSGGRFSLYGGITNLTDKQPPLAGAGQYDIIGRYYTLGARYRF